ncbi:hypothetical protein PENTCL1PPCAC_13105, partial [Pristionchus entomophagus]
DGQLNIRPALVFLTAMLMMGLHTSIALFLACKTIAEISKAKTFSPNYKQLQMRILRALIAQSIVPIFFVYIPIGCLIIFPFLGIDDVFHIGDHCMTFTSFFPAWDAIIVIMLIKDYR